MLRQKLTLIFLSACLYIAEAELTNNLKKLLKVKSGKKDYTHHHQLLYALWINSLNDSRHIIRRHGLIPEPIHRKGLKKLMPPFAALINHFESKDKTTNRDTCNTIIEFFFSSGKQSLLGAHSARLFSKQAFYNKSRSLLIYLKLFVAYALKDLNPLHRKIPFLKGGQFRYCTFQMANSENVRDTLYFRSDESNDDYRKVDDFHDFQLETNLIYLSPQAIAAQFFSTRNNTNDKMLNDLRKSVKDWNNHCSNKPYITMPADDASSVDDDRNDNEKKQVGKKAFTKNV